jgi:rhodanese-related sulfurtransferase
MTTTQTPAATEQDGRPLAITPEHAVTLREGAEPGSLLDVRSFLEYETEHVAGSLHVAMDELPRRLDDVRALTAPVLLLCRSGVRAKTAQQTLAGAGITHTQVVEQGIQGWRAAGGATVLGVARMSLERQVRIAAGSLGLAGVLLGFLVHTGFFLLSGFVSAGLIFAGLTDWCGMGLLLARMPWNKARS